MTQWCCRKLFPRARMKVLKAGQVYGMFLLKIKVTRVHSKHRRLQERLEVPGLSSWIQDTWLTCDVKVYVSFHSPYFIGSHATVDSRNSRVGHSQGASRLQKKRQLQRKDEEPLDTPWDISERDMIDPADNDIPEEDVKMFLRKQKLVSEKKIWKIKCKRSFGRNIFSKIL